MNQNNYVVIMAGGIGSRFWPMSRTTYPKQFLDILNTGETLLQSTFNRFQKIVPSENIFVITADAYVDIVKEQLPSMSIENIVGEPERKNTAPCILYMALKLKKHNSNANIIVAPSDHMIEDQELFQTNCLDALNFAAENDAFVTMGIKPTYANTGYGYIQHEDTFSMPSMFPVKRFTEKPDLETAIEFFEDGSFLWNSGIFIWKADDIVNAFKLHMPKMYNLFVSDYIALNTTFEKIAIEHIYQYCESISIDYAILEKVKNVFVIPASFGWSDLGTWNSAWENTEKDDWQNAVYGKNTLMVNANGCLVHSTDKKLVLIGGMENLIVVNTTDALLICKKENEQAIKEYLVRVKQVKGEVYL